MRRLLRGLHCLTSRGLQRGTVWQLLNDNVILAPTIIKTLLTFGEIDILENVCFYPCTLQVKIFLKMLLYIGLKYGTSQTWKRHHISDTNSHFSARHLIREGISLKDVSLASL